MLLRDITCALAVQPRTGASRRAVAQAIFAAVEGILWTVQCKLLSAGDQKLCEAERVFLWQETQALSESDAVAPKVRLKQRLVFTASVVRRLRPECRINFDDLAWKSLLSTLDLRDRLIPLRNRADLDLTDAELRKALIGEAWFLDNIVAVVQTGIRGYREDIQSERAFLRALSKWSSAEAEIGEADIESAVPESAHRWNGVTALSNWARSPDQSKILNSDKDRST